MYIIIAKNYLIHNHGALKYCLRQPDEVASSTTIVQKNQPSRMGRLIFGGTGQIWMRCRPGMDGN